MENLDKVKLKIRQGKWIALVLLVVMVISSLPSILGDNTGTPPTDPRGSNWNGWSEDGLILEIVGNQGGRGGTRFRTTHYLMTIGPGGGERSAAKAIGDSLGVPLDTGPRISPIKHDGQTWQVTALIPVTEELSAGGTVYKRSVNLEGLSIPDDSQLTGKRPPLTVEELLSAFAVKDSIIMFTESLRDG